MNRGNELLYSSPELVEVLPGLVAKELFFIGVEIRVFTGGGISCFC